MNTTERDEERETLEAGAEPATSDERPKVRLAPDGRLLVITDGGPVAVRVRLCFPWSEPRRLLSLRDTHDDEVALIEDPSAMEGESRAAVEQALVEAGFVLDVKRVLKIEEEVEIRHWEVETRQGRRSFQTHLDDWPRALRGGGLLVRDVAGDLYRLSDPARLDAQSRELLWAFVD
jgi:hypothetical protein